MIAGSFVSADHYRLELVRTLSDDQSQGLSVRLLNEAGTAITTFVLPEDIISALAASDEEWLLTMSPSGSIAVYYGDDTPQRLLEIELDELIAQNLVPEMLADEPHLKDRLLELRCKLSEALALVDHTLAGLGKSAD